MYDYGISDKSIIFLSACILFSIFHLVAFFVLKNKINLSKRLDYKMNLIIAEQEHEIEIIKNDIAKIALTKPEKYKLNQTMEPIDQSKIMILAIENKNNEKLQYL